MDLDTYPMKEAHKKEHEVAEMDCSQLALHGTAEGGNEDDRHDDRAEDLQTDAGPQLVAGYATYARLGCNLAGDMTGVETDDGHLEGTSIQVVALVC